MLLNFYKSCLLNPRYLQAARLQSSQLWLVGRPTTSRFYSNNNNPNGKNGYFSDGQNSNNGNGN